MMFLAGKKFILLGLIIGLCVGSAAGFFLSSSLYMPQIITLQDKVLITQNKLSSIERRYASLNDSYSELNSKYLNLSKNYTELTTLYNALNASKERLNDKYNRIKGYYQELTTNVLDLRNMLRSYISIPEAFPRVLNNQTIKETKDAVIEATRSSTDIRLSTERIYRYITTNIIYAQDIDMPYLSSYWHVTIDGFDYIINFTTERARNYIQTPNLTLSIKKGDCDDQAILAYAMIKYYMKYIYGKEYDLYIADIDFPESGHLAVFLPVKNGEICIVDPAGKYLTSNWGRIASKPALQELHNYSKHWSDPITCITLYNVNVIDGSFEVVAEGTIEEISSVFG